MVLALVLTACSGKKEAGNSNQGTTSQGSSQSSQSTDSTGSGGDSGGQAQDKVTFNMFVAVQGEKDVNTNETVIGKKLEEQTGVNFRIEHLVGELQTKIGTMIASNDYPDVLVPDDGIENVIEAGGFIDLTPYIDNDKYPNIKKVFGPYKNLMKWEDGKIYIFPFSTVVGDFNPDPNIGQGAFWVQRRVLEWAGYPKIKTVDQYFKLLEDFINAHKDEDLIGFVTLTDDWRFFATTNVPNHLAGYPNDGEVMVDLQTHEAKIYAGTDWEYRWYKKLNEINAKGMFDKQSFVDNYDQYIAKLTSHKVLGFFDYGWQVGTANNALRDAALADPSQDGYRYFPLPVVFDENIKDQYIDPPGYVANRGFGITTSAKDPERIISFIDTLLKEKPNPRQVGHRRRNVSARRERPHVPDQGNGRHADAEIQRRLRIYRVRLGLAALRHERNAVRRQRHVARPATGSVPDESDRRGQEDSVGLWRANLRRIVRRSGSSPVVPGMGLREGRTAAVVRTAKIRPAAESYSETRSVEA